MLKQDTFPGTLAKITGDVEISMARLNSRQPKMVGIWLDMQAMFWFVHPCSCCVDAMRSRVSSLSRYSNALAHTRRSTEIATASDVEIARDKARKC